MAEPRKKMMLVPVDFSEHSKAALGRALELARALGHEIALLHAFDSSTFQTVGRADQVRPELAKLAGRLLEDAKARLAELAHEADPERRIIKIVDVIEGRPWQVILGVAASTSPALIVVGKHAEGPISVGLGSVSERVVRGAMCDVLVVRER